MIQRLSLNSPFGVYAVVYFKSFSEQRGKRMKKLSMSKKFEITDVDCCLMVFLNS